VNFIVLAPVQYDVSQDNRMLGPVNITTHTSPDCAGTMHSNENKICTINNIIQYPTGQLKIITHNVNNCRPQTACTSIASNYPFVHVHTFVGNQYQELSSFPGSETGRNLIFSGDILGYRIQEGFQYDVLQENPHAIGLSIPYNITTHTSPDCAGTIHDNENKICTINNTVTNSSQNTTAVITAQPANIPSARK
jgi:hypothetical protein